MMARDLRERTKQIPILGPLLYHSYLKIFFGEGKPAKIRGGLLAGKTWLRFMRTTVDNYIAGTHEMPVQDALAKYLRPGMVFYDVGANGGFFSLLGSYLVGPAGRVVAYEPHPITAAQLKKQIRANDMTNVDVVVAAVSDTPGMAKLSDDTSSDTLSLVDAERARRTITVVTTTLDRETKVRPAPDILKIDVEGAEIEVLRGGREFIFSSRPILLVEIHSAEIATKYDDLMSELGYETLDLSGNKISAKSSGERFVVSRPRSIFPLRLTED
jgi:FkbM family methyltransferase